MITVTPSEIDQFRSEFEERPEALKVLDVIEDCEGDLEDAAIVLALQVKQEPDTSERWLEGLAKRWRHVICREEIKDNLMIGAIATAVDSLATSTGIPQKLAIPIIIYVTKTGVEGFCQPLEEKIQG